jgi:hypothetical protein
MDRQFLQAAKDGDTEKLQQYLNQTTTMYSSYDRRALGAHELVNIQVQKKGSYCYGNAYACSDSEFRDFRPIHLATMNGHTETVRSSGLQRSLPWAVRTDRLFEL